MDLFQIAQEHHRGGRYRQAEETYRNILSNHPDDPDALHWLGILILQSGRPTDAIPLLQRAAEIRPTDSAFIHNLAQAYLSAHRPEDAARYFDRAISLNPTPKVLYSAALAHLSLQTPPSAARAVELFQQARAAGLDSPELHQHLGLAYLLADRLDESLEELQTAVRQLPESAEPHLHFAAAWARKGQRGPARVCLARALEIDPTFARAAYALAVMESEDGRLPEAEALLRAAISMKPDSPAAYQALAQVLHQSGLEREGNEAAQTAAALARGELVPAQAATPSDSIAALEERLARSPDAQKLHVLLSMKANVAPPAKLPPGSISGLFDRYADQFDQHLVEKLDYHVPEMILEAVAGADRPELMDILDLGCGTGLCGPLLRPMAGSLVGVDASPEMIKKARARLAYDRLEVADIVEFLKTSPNAFDLLVAADVLVYLGDLTPFFQAAASALRQGGMLAFSVEADPGDRFRLQTATRRFTHSEAYLRHLADIFGFKIDLFRPITVRLECRKPVAGYLVLLKNP
jgi:predicted TPR repeat methyltransferase/thioredoxin-like negative regulator of GroEL